MNVNKRNKDRVEKLFYFCLLYISHRDFDLQKRLSKQKPLNYNQAEKLSNFFNELVVTRESSPQDFIANEEDSINNSIDKYIILKNNLKEVKEKFGAKYKNELYKSVKNFYRKRMYCYQMDSFFTFTIYGLYLYINKIITFEEFLEDYGFEISIFTGKKSLLDLKKTIKIAQYILTI